jgi:hypothetical protein
VTKYKKITEFTLSLGRIIVVENDKRRGQKDWQEILDTIVEIDNEQFKVRGVERSQTSHTNIGTHIGLLVEDIKK